VTGKKGIRVAGGLPAVRERWIHGGLERSQGEETQSVLVVICQWCSRDEEISRLLCGAKKMRTREESWEKYKINNERRRREMAALQ
jgi:hypothetical protein